METELCSRIELSGGWQGKIQIFLFNFSFEKKNSEREIGGGVRGEHACILKL